MKIATEKGLHRLLVNLGRTPDEIAAKLAAKGITGHKSDAGTCPIANYINTQDGVRRAVHYQVTHVTLSSTGQLIQVRNDWGADTYPTFLFATAFDRGDYPELEA